MTIRHAVALAILVVFATACEDDRGPTAVDTSPQFANGNSGPSASGHTNLTISGELQTFSFSAREKKDGRVSGQFEVFSRGQETQLHGYSSCLNVDGNEALVFGIVTNAKDEGIFNITEGSELFWAVRDNGPGNTDEWTDIGLLSFGGPSGLDCGDFLPGDFLAGGVVDNEGGSVRVRP